MRFINHKAAATQRLTVHALNGRLSFAITAHFHKAESFRTPSVPLHHDFGTYHIAKLRKGLLQIMITYPVGQISTYNFISITYSCAVKPMLFYFKIFELFECGK